MLVLQNDKLQFSFPEVHPDATCGIHFQRTLRIPDDSRSYPLPPGLGPFPLFHVDDYAAGLPAAWTEHGGVFFPMYQAEAMWIRFDAWSDYPCAVKVAAGKIDAVTGAPWSPGLSDSPQNYMVVPDQPWMDGFCVQKGLIRQFVAMPLGEGFTAEEQIAGHAEHGGLQLIVYPMRRQHYEALLARRSVPQNCPIVCEYSLGSEGMGLAPGGLMRQEIYGDKHGLDVWDMNHASRCFVHIVNSARFEAITGQKPPTLPPTARDYTDAGLPWFEYYAPTLEALSGSPTLAGLDSLAAAIIKKGLGPLHGNEPASTSKVINCGPKVKTVREGTF
ncbi:MAG: hypothetical protein AB1720_00450 [Pseudomonadota bacterium]